MLLILYIEKKKSIFLYIQSVNSGLWHYEVVWHEFYLSNFILFFLV